MQVFIDRNGLADVDQIADIQGEIWERFDVTEHRTYIFISADGTVEKKGYGSLEEDVQALIANSTAP